MGGRCSPALRVGGTLAFTYQSESVKDRVIKLSKDFGTEIVIPCDVASDQEIERLFASLKGHWDGLDGIVHSIAYAPREQLDHDYLESVTREGFRVAHEISSYSLAALAKAGLGLMKGRDGAILTLSSLGAIRSVPRSWRPPRLPK